MQRIHIRRSRSGLTNCSAISSSTCRSRRTRPASAAHTAAFTASATNAACTPPLATIAGRATAPAKPPIGIAACRIPSASPRSSGPNQCITARPLAELTDAPNAPVATSAATSAANPFTFAATASARADPVSPITIASRSPIRSLTIPQPSSVSVIPAFVAPRRRPISPMLRSYCARSAGVIALIPICTAERLVAESVPAARISQR